MRRTNYLSALFTVAALMGIVAAIPARAQRPEALKIINGPRVEGTGDSWAMIAWTTNTGGSSIVRYGTDPNHLDQTAQAPYADNESTSYQVHRVQVKNLKPGTTYYFMVDSGQGEGTGTEAKSQASQFTTTSASRR